jgi:hypothetical protein
MNDTVPIVTIVAGKRSPPTIGTEAGWYREKVFYRPSPLSDAFSKSVLEIKPG